MEEEQGTPSRLPPAPNLRKQASLFMSLKEGLRQGFIIVSEQGKGEAGKQMSLFDYVWQATRGGGAENISPTPHISSLSQASGAQFQLQRRVGVLGTKAPPPPCVLLLGWWFLRGTFCPSLAWTRTDFLSPHPSGYS